MLPPLSLYIHIPWCTRKCPYCDFNSHEGMLPQNEKAYVHKLIEDLKYDLNASRIDRPLISIFIGGGTPSLFSTDAIDFLLVEINKLMDFKEDIEITMEANPASSQSDYFRRLSRTLVNRVSLGVQSFHPEHLHALGRLHSKEEALFSIEQIKTHFDNFNIDLMFGLPQQSLEQGINDLEQALSFSPPHLSWYQLTIEPNTVFYRQQPVLPDHDTIFELQTLGADLLNRHGLVNYEISAYAQKGRKSMHNLNYWEFGDYLGIGAGAHSKISSSSPTGIEITRFNKTRQPKDYLDHGGHQLIANKHQVSGKELALEFLMNYLRLENPLLLTDFQNRTGLGSEILDHFIKAGEEKKLLSFDNGNLEKTTLGKLHLDTLLALF